jgi:sporulation protein YlmC with PRC-barrel domain
MRGLAPPLSWRDVQPFKPKVWLDMAHSDQLSETIGYSVIAHREGAQLGDVAHVFLDPENKNISGMTLKSKVFGKESWFGVEEIETIGTDVILLKGEASLTPLAKAGVTKGKSLKDIRGTRVVTADGKLLGTLDDFEVQGDDWSISELYLDKNRRLPVASAEIKIGEDQIIVPAEYSERVVEEPEDNSGFFHKIFGAKKEEG